MKIKKLNPDMMAQDEKLARKDGANDPADLVRPMYMAGSLAVQGASMVVWDQSTRVARDTPGGAVRPGAAPQ